MFPEKKNYFLCSFRAFAKPHGFVFTALLVLRNLLAIGFVVEQLKLVKTPVQTMHRKLQYSMLYHLEKRARGSSKVFRFDYHSTDQAILLLAKKIMNYGTWTTCEAFA